jgi:Zn-dependent metalloprotease
MCSFIPSYLTKHILEFGNEAQKDAAIHTLRGTHQMKKAANQAILSTRFLESIGGKRIVNWSEGKKRNVYDAEQKTRLPGKLVRGEGEKSKGDVAVDEAYDGSGATYDLFKDVYGRDSIDGKGMILKSTVHFGRNFNNAFWNGFQMSYGDGDKIVFRSFTLLDITGHEICHGVTERSAGLRYFRQSGAINESMSDVFGSCVKQRVLNQTVDQADWLIGAGIFMPNINGRAIRDMANPGTAYSDPAIGSDRQIWHMKDYKDIDEDQGGVHIYSAVGNKSFHIAAMEIGGNSWNTMGPVWYNALTLKLKPDSQFKDCADATVQSAREIYGVDSKEQKAVKNGWKYVGVQSS